MIDGKVFLFQLLESESQQSLLSIDSFRIICNMEGQECRLELMRQCHEWSAFTTKNLPSAYIGGQSSSPREPCLVEGTGRRQADCALGGLVRISAYSWSYTICFFLQFWSQTHFCLYYEYSSHIWFLCHNHNHISICFLSSVWINENKTQFAS